MAEYIERAETAEFFEKSKQTMWHKDDIAATISSKKNIPSADVVEVIHACWQWSKVNGQYGYYCSNCQAGWANSENAEWIAKSHDYCPKCGAKMDGERRLDE